MYKLEEIADKELNSDFDRPEDSLEDPE